MKNIGKRGRQDWATPRWLFDQINTRFGPFDVDVCAEAWSAKCVNFFSEELNGLKQDWGGIRFFCNPPFGQAHKWIKKGYDTVRYAPNTFGVYVLSAATDTAWFHNYVAHGKIYFLKGRIQFDPPPDVVTKGSGNNAGSMIAVFESDRLNASGELDAEIWDIRK